MANIKLRAYLLNVVHHDPFDIRQVGFHLGELVNFLWMIDAILHMIFQPRATPTKHKH